MGCLYGIFINHYHNFDYSNSGESFTARMRKFVSNGNQNNANAPVSRRKKKSDSSSESTNTVSRSSSEPALNQPQEAFIKEAPSMGSLLYNKKPAKKKKSFFK